MKIKQLALIVSIVTALVFMVQNTQVVSVKFLFWEFSMSRIILITIVLAIGIIIGMVLVKNRKI
ncbi:MAG: LapA family protein [Elusimicrobiota bacterium]